MPLPQWGAGDCRRLSKFTVGMGIWMQQGFYNEQSSPVTNSYFRTKLGCPRTQGNSIGITEDCLYLNVFTKNLVKNQRNAYEQVCATFKILRNKTTFW
jgi:hypothetical protein